MKKLTLDEWEKKYIVGPIERFDQKNSMFLRPDWDGELRGKLKDWSFMSVASQDKPGWHVEDLALKKGPFAIVAPLTLFNYAKPNPERVTQAILETMVTAYPGVAAAMASMSAGPAKIDISNPQRVTSIVKKAAHYYGADLVGICKLDRRWVYSQTYDANALFAGSSEEPLGRSKPQEIPNEFQYAIVMGFEMDYNICKYFMSPIAIAATWLGYSRMAFTNAAVSGFIESLGFKAINCTTNDVALSPPMAMQAGLGDIGRNGLIITPQFGPRVRLSKVITDLPLVPDSPIDFGVTEFCEACGKCADACPSESISHGKRTTEPNNISNVSGELKWPTDAETCRMFWSKTNIPAGCTVCVSSCPYNKVDTWPHRTVRWFTDHFRWADPLYVKLDDLFGYGRPKKPDNFWEEFQPSRH